MKAKAALAVAAALLAPAAVALAQAKDAARGDQLAAIALRLRHDGELDQASAAFEAAIDAYPDGPAKRVAQLEAHELAVLEGKHDRAARIAKGWDLDREAVGFARAGKAELALELARDAKDALAEGRVLHVLGRDAEALAALERAGRPGALDRGALLLQLGRFTDAAKAFEDAGDTLRRALALEQAKDTAAPVAFEAAKVEDRTRLDGLLAREKDARARQKAAAPGLAAERARYDLASVLDQLVDVSERLSIELEKSGDAARAADFAQTAADSARTERETLVATNDRYGALVAGARGLEAREKRLAERAKKLRG